MFFFLLILRRAEGFVIGERSAVQAPEPLAAGPSFSTEQNSRARVFMPRDSCVDVDCVQGDARRDLGWSS